MLAQKLLMQETLQHIGMKLVHYLAKFLQRQNRDLKNV